MQTLRERIEPTVNALLDLVSYRACLFCELPLGSLRRVVCRRCARELLSERLVAPFLPAAFEAAGAAAGSGGIAGVWAAAAYERLIREALLGFKFHGRLTLLPVLASLAAQRLRALRREFEPQVIVPVPTTLLRFLYRGTNLPQAIARSLSARFRIPWIRALRRAPIGRRQTRKSKKERLKLAPATFRAIRPRRVRGRRVLLVDDVLTTGGTVLACAKALLASGAAAVGVLAVAHGG